MELQYNSGTNKFYNGNIAYQLSTSYNQSPKTYTYAYDALNRLTDGTSTDNNSETGISYDPMGNIKHLARSGNSSAGSFDYTYFSGTNQLQNVSGLTVNDYHYDTNGNMDHDGRNNTDITYNILNLPATVPGKNLTYIYDATGRKLRKISSGTVTEYIDGIQYTGNTIDFVQTEEGRILNPTGTANYEYSLSDHLGNSRVNFDSSHGGTVATQVNDYYPFGLVAAQPTITSPPNKYLYNKKELQDETGQYDYGARFYDPVIGRWTSVDPLAAKIPGWSPYTAMGDNPILMFDPDGAFPWPVHIRSFISTSSTGGGLFYGDGRGPSLSTARDVTSRVRTTFVVDPSKGVITKPSFASDPTIFYGAWIGDNYIPPMVKRGSPTASITNDKYSPGSVSFDFSHSGKDPITPGLFTPALDVHAGLTFKEDLKKGVLSISGSFTGDTFPSSEAFITDQSGKTKLFLGAKMEQGGISDLFGDNKKPLFNVNMQVQFDTDGNFTGVTEGRHKYTVDQWNKKVQGDFKK